MDTLFKLISIINNFYCMSCIVAVTVERKCNGKGFKESKKALYFKSPLLCQGYSMEL